MKVASCSESYRTQLAEYDKGLQRTPSYIDDSRAVWHVDSCTRYHFIRVVLIPASEVEQVSHQQQVKHDDDDSQRTTGAEAAAVGCCCCCRCGGEGALPANDNEGRMTKK